MNAKTYTYAKCLVASGLLIGVSALAPTTTNAQAVSSARNLAMGNATIGIASGADAALINPANLGLYGHRKTEIQLVGVGAQISNNAFSLNDYNTYTGAFLDDDDKEYILSRIPGEGLKLRAEVGANAMAISLGNFVLSTSAVGAADLNVSKDIFELALYGNEVGDTISVTGSYSEAVGYGSANLSYGTSLYKNGSRELAVGATVKYLYGLGVQRIIENTGSASTTYQGFAGSGSVVVQTATGGSGYAVDLGSAIKLSKSYTVSACVHNAFSRINWSKDTKENGFIFEFDSMTVENSDADYVITDDYEKDIDGFSTSLPAKMNIGLGKTQGNLLWSVEWEQGLENGAGASTTPRVGGGAELHMIPLMPLRAGVTAGGGLKPSFSAGTGLHFPLLYIDFAAVTNSGLGLYDAKGIQFAVTTGLRF